MAYQRVRPTLFDYIQQSFSVQQDGGCPQVEDLPNDLIEQGGRPYMRRYFLLGDHNMTDGSTARYHQILESDHADLHDHPWDFVSVILKGSYVETTPDGECEYSAGSVLVRTAEQLHRLSLASGPVWTFVILSPPRRRWGFETPDGWLDWRSYLGAEGAPASIGGRWAV